LASEKYSCLYKAYFHRLVELRKEVENSFLTPYPEEVLDALEAEIDEIHDCIVVLRSLEGYAR
jgi:hypothetical protein